MQRTLEAVLGRDAVPTWADPHGLLPAYVEMWSRTVQELRARGYSSAEAHAATAALLPENKGNIRACASLLDNARKGYGAKGSMAKRVEEAMDPLGASDWWLGCDAKTIDVDRKWPDETYLSWAEYQQLRREIEAPYNARSLEFTRLYVRHCVPLGGPTAQPQSQPWPDAEEYLPWPADWFYDTRFCIDGKECSLLPSDCPATDPALGYRALRQHWQAKGDMAAEGDTMCAHGNSQHKCATCFDDELRRVVALRFAGADAREAYLRQRRAEEDAHHAWAAECAQRQRQEAEVRRALEEERRLEEEVRRREEAQRSEERYQAMVLAQQQADTALVERLLAEAQRPMITESNAKKWPPPYPYARRCLGDECSCKEYVFNRLIADKYPRRYKKKNPFACRGTRKDPWVCQTPCSGELMHFTLSEPHTTIAWNDGRLVRSYLVSESSELMLWYAQVVGKPWLRGPFPCTPAIIDIEDGFNKAFKQWRRLVDSAEKSEASTSASVEQEGGEEGEESEDSQDSEEGEEGEEDGEAQFNADEKAHEVWMRAHLRDDQKAEALADAIQEREFARLEDPDLVLGFG